MILYWIEPGLPVSVGTASPGLLCTAEMKDLSCDKMRKYELLSCTLVAAQTPLGSIHSANCTTSKSACRLMYVDSSPLAHQEALGLLWSFCQVWPSSVAALWMVLGLVPQLID